jgi:succinate dehydrogenase flavin-adding protein (antitoxin of CptAB toxin-antitoxin module)
MGQTVPPYRIVTEMERSQWKSFRALLGTKDRKLFDEMFSYSRLYNSAGSNVCRSILKLPILMSILLEHYKQLTKLGFPYKDEIIEIS